MAICVATRRRCGFRILSVPRRNLFQSFFDQLVDEIVGFDAQSFAAGDFDVGRFLSSSDSSIPISMQVRGESATIS